MRELVMAPPNVSEYPAVATEQAENLPAIHCVYYTHCRGDIDGLEQRRTRPGQPFLAWWRCSASAQICLSVFSLTPLSRPSWMAAFTAWTAAVRACCSLVRSRTGARSSSGWPCASARLFACSRRPVMAGSFTGGQSRCVKKGPPEEKVRTNGWSWLRGSDSNRRPPGYEPDELPLLHPARHCSEPAGAGQDGLGTPAYQVDVPNRDEAGKAT